jgi:TfoX/Sxy family transcriptional regulator of competence genes
MTYDEDLADRVRTAIGDLAVVTEKRMFGGLGFLVNGNLAVSASSRGGLMLRVDPADLESVLAEDGVTPFEMHGRAMNGWVHVDASAAASPDQLDRWVGMGTTYAASLPPK